MRSLVCIIFIVSLFGCNKTENNYSFVQSNEISNQYGIPIDSTILYYPYKLIKDSFHLEYLMLYQMDEPILYNYYLNKDVYRFCWVRNWSPCVLFRFEKEDDKISLITKVIVGKKILKMIDTTFISYINEDDSAYFANRLRNIPKTMKEIKEFSKIYITDTAEYKTIYSLFEKRQIFTSKEWIKFKNILNEYSSVDSKDKMSENREIDIWMDCPIWYLEKHKEEGYYVYHSMCPVRTERAFFNICKYIVELNGDFKIEN